MMGASAPVARAPYSQGGGMKAVGNAPVAFVTDDGQQLIIPMSAIEYDANNTPTTSFVTEPKLNAWLALLHQRGLLSLEDAPPPLPALVLRAASPGGWGNNITVKIEASATAGAVDVTAGLMEMYQSLKADEAMVQIPALVVAQERRGLVNVEDRDTGNPVPQTPAPDASADPPEWPLDNGAGGTALTLRGAYGIAAADTTVEVLDVAGDTFALKVTWEHKVTGVKVADLPGALDPLKVVVEVKEPASGFALPSPANSSLAGGEGPSIATTTFLHS